MLYDNDGTSREKIADESIIPADNASKNVLNLLLILFLIKYTKSAPIVVPIKGSNIPKIIFMLLTLLLIYEA